MQHSKIADPVSASFGEDKPAVNYDSIAAQVRAVNAHSLAPSQYDDVVTLIEWMRDEAVKMHDQNKATSEALAARERDVAKRERDVGIRSRALDAAKRTRGILSYLKR